MHIQDVRVNGWLPLQHHDRTHSITDRTTLGAVRIHPIDDPLNPEPAGQTYGDIQGGLLWEEVAGKRQYLHSWWLTGVPAVASESAAGPHDPKATKTKDKPTSWLPIRSAGAVPDERYTTKNPARPDWYKGTLPKGWTATVTSGSEEFAQTENLHPDFWGLVSVNYAGDPAAGTLVYDLTEEGEPDPDRAAHLQSLLSVVSLDSGPALALQLGAGGRLDGGDGHALWIDHDAQEVGYGDVSHGGPLTTGGPLGCSIHALGKDKDGNTIRPIHFQTGSLFIGLEHDGPLGFEAEPYDRSAVDLPKKVRGHIRFDDSVGQWLIQSSCIGEAIPPLVQPPSTLIGIVNSEYPLVPIPLTEIGGGGLLVLPTTVGTVTTPTGSPVGTGLAFGALSQGVLVSGWVLSGDDTGLYGTPVDSTGTFGTAVSLTSGGSGTITSDGLNITGDGSAGDPVTLASNIYVTTATIGDATISEVGGSLLVGDGSGTALTVDGDQIITGKLTVAGLIDPTGFVFDAQASAPTGANAQTLWLDSTHNHVQQGTGSVDALWLGYNGLSELRTSAAASVTTVHTIKKIGANVHDPDDGLSLDLIADTGSTPIIFSRLTGKADSTGGYVETILASYGSGGSIDTGPAIALLDSEAAVQLRGNALGLELPDQASDTATPAAGFNKLYSKSKRLYYRNEDGTVYGPLDSASGSSDFADNAFTIHNVTDATKLLAFDISGVTTGTTRTLTAPDASGTIALTSDLPTPADLTKTDDTNVTLTLGGTPTGSLLEAVSLTLGWTGSLATTRGGTAITSYTLGDTLYSDATDSLAKLAGNTTTTRKFLRQTGNGTISAAPAWDTLVAGDIPDLSATYATVAYTDHGALSGLGDDDHTQYLLADGTRALSADWDAGSFEVRAQTLYADVATGTAPLTIASTTLVSNLNADLLDGQHGSYYLDLGNATGTLALARFGTETANYVLAGPTTGAAAAPTFRALVAADIPDLSATYQPLDAQLTALAALGYGTAGQVIATNATADGLEWVDQTGGGGTPHYSDADFQLYYNVNDADYVMFDLSNITAARTLKFPNVSGTLLRDPTTTAGDIIWRSGANSTGDLSRLAVGAANTLLKSDGSSPSWATLSALIDSAIGSTRGSILYRGASAWAALSPGTSGNVLTSNGTGADPTYQAVSAGVSLIGKAYDNGSGTGVSVTVPANTLSSDGQVLLIFAGASSTGGSSHLKVNGGWIGTVSGAGYFVSIIRRTGSSSATYFTGGVGGTSTTADSNLLSNSWGSSNTIDISGGSYSAVVVFKVP